MKNVRTSEYTELRNVAEEVGDRKDSAQVHERVGERQARICRNASVDNAHRHYRYHVIEPDSAYRHERACDELAEKDRCLPDRVWKQEVPGF